MKKLNFSIILVFILSLNLVSCSCSGTRFDVRDTGQLYQGTGVSRFFLNQAPYWANFSTSAQCQRDPAISFLNFPELRQNFSLSYEQAIKFQYVLNHEVDQKGQEKTLLDLPVDELEMHFFNTLNRIESGLPTLPLPNFKRVHLVWVDPALQSPEQMKRLETLMKSSSMNQGHPVLVSLCRSGKGLEQLIIQKNWEDRGMHVLPVETFSVYGPDQKHEMKFMLDFKSLFKKDQELVLYVPKEKGEQVPAEFAGKFLKVTY